MSVWNERQFYTGNPVHSSFQTKRNLSLVQIAVLQREFTWAAYLIYEQNGFDAKFIHFSNWYFDNRSVFVACLLAWLWLFWIESTRSHSRQFDAVVAMQFQIYFNKFHKTPREILYIFLKELYYYLKCATFSSPSLY